MLDQMEDSSEESGTASCLSAIPRQDANAHSAFQVPSGIVCVSAIWLKAFTLCQLD